MSQIYQLNNAVYPPGTVVQTLTPDTGTSPVVPDAANTINILGGILCETVGSLNTLTINIDEEVASQYDCDTGSAVPAANILNVVGDAVNIDTTGAGDTVTISLIGTTDHAVQIGNAAGNLTSLAIGTDGQVLIGATGADAAFATITSTGGTIAFTPGANTLNMETGAIVAIQYDADTGSAVPAAGILNVLGGTAGRNINTTGATDTLRVEMNNTITLGDLSAVGAGSDALTLTTGDLSIVAGNLNIPSTNAALSVGVIEQNGTRFLSTFGTNNIFMGNASGNGTLTGTQNFIISQMGGQALTTGANNVGIGSLVFEDITSGAGNCALGPNALRNVTQGAQNCGVGNSAALTTTTGSYNTCLGYVAGSTIGAASNSNIYLVHAGTTENNTMRLGTTGTGNAQVSRAFMAGTYGVTPGGGNDGMVIIDSNGQLGSQTDLLMPTNPAFQATVTSTIGSITGAGTQYTIVWDTERFDQDSNFDGTSTFVAPVTGKYHLSLTVRMVNLTAAMTRSLLYINTSNQNYILSGGSPGATKDANDSMGFNLDVICDMDASDTAIAQIIISNGAGDTAGVAGNYTTNTPGAFFSGSLVT